MASASSFLDSPRQIVGSTLVVAAVIVGFVITYYLRDVLFMLFVGTVLATALDPMIAVVQHVAPKPVAVGAVYACLILALAVLVVAGAPYVTSQVGGLMSDVPRASQQARQWLDSAGDVLWANVARRIVAESPPSSPSMGAEKTVAAVGQTTSYLAMALRGIVTVCVTVLLAFYWSLQGDRTFRWLLLLLPSEKREGARETIAEMEEKVGAYLRGQGLVCLAMVIMATVTYGLLGLRYFVVLGLVAGLLEVMPVLGPIVGAIPPLSVALFTDPGKTPWVLAAAIVIQQIEGYLIVPRIMDKSVGVHPMVTLLAIAAFGALFGLAGAVLAIPLAAIVQVLLNRYVLVPAANERKPPDGRGALSVLHYDSQKLLCDIRLRSSAEPPAGGIGHLSETIEAIARDLDERLKTVDGQGDVEDSP